MQLLQCYGNLNVTESDCTGRFEGLVQEHYKTLASARNNGTFAVNFFTFFSFTSYQSTSISKFVNCVFIGRFVENTEWNNETEKSYVTVMKCCVTGSESLHRCPKSAINHRQGFQKPYYLLQPQTYSCVSTLGHSTSIGYTLDASVSICHTSPPESPNLVDHTSIPSTCCINYTFCSVPLCSQCSSHYCKAI